jgi:hypothetical protein
MQMLSLETFEMVDKFSKKDTKQCRHIIQKVLEQFADLKFYIARQGEIIGNYSKEELTCLIRAREFNGNDFYWTKNMGNAWGSLSDIINTLI